MNFHFKKLKLKKEKEKENQGKSKVNRQKETKIEINGEKTQKTEASTNPKVGPLERFIKMDNPLGRFAQEKKKPPYILALLEILQTLER